MARIDSGQLEAFIRVAEMGSISRAALALGMTQPALSRRLHALEQSLGRLLFRRNGRGVQLTEAGTRLLDHARGVVRGLEAALQSVQDPEGRRGRIAVGLPPSVGRVLIRTFAAGFAGRFPQASLALVEGLSEGLHEKLLAGRIDLALLLNATPSRLVHVEPIATEPLYIVAARPLAPAGRALSLAQIASLPLILPGAPHPIRALVEAEAARMGLGLEIVLEVDAVGAMIELIADRRGCSIMPRNVLRADAAARGLAWHPIDSALLQTTLSVARQAGTHRSALAEGTERLLREQMLEVLRRDPGAGLPAVALSARVDPSAALSAATRAVPSAAPRIRSRISARR
jgi:LysR family nitrogen assimilation transcriptional regulator